jgi:hypothetical protein
LFYAKEKKKERLNLTGLKGGKRFAQKLGKR